MERSKRDYSRVEVSWPVIVVTSHGSIDGEITNISLSGALIRCRELPDPNETIELNFMIPEHDNYPMTVSAGIIRIITDHRDNSSTLSDIGVCFTEIAEEDLRYLSNSVLF